MVKTTLAIEREVDDTRSIRDMSASAKRKKNQSPSSSKKKQKTSASHIKDRVVATRAKAKVNHSGVGGTSVILASRGR